MISVTDLRSGTTFEEDGQLFQVLSYEHIKMGRGSASVRLKVKNLRSGATTQKSFISSGKVSEASLTKKKCQYLYKDSQEAFFMDTQTFEQFPFSFKALDTQALFLKEGMEINVSFFDSEPLSLELPIKMEFEVADTTASIRGNSETNIFKDAILDNGTRVKVPLFVKVGDKVVIDTRTSEYIERAN